jgi:DNA adenine methylase
MKPIIKYRGGKSKELTHILEHIPNNIETYIEPFVGGGALYFYLEPERAIINDINRKLITFYTHLKNNYESLILQLQKLQNTYEKNQEEYEKVKKQNPDLMIENKNEGLYYEMRSIFNNPNNKYLESAVYFFINKTAYSGMIRYNKNGEFNVPYGRYRNFNTKLINEKHHELLAKTEIYCEDYSHIFNVASERDFMFLDPPYDCIFNDYGNLDMEDGFNENAHKRLAQDFRNLTCPTLMVISKTPLTKSLYTGLITEEYNKSYTVNIRNRFKNKAKHMIIKNY